jgi:hypothetical protein
VNPEPIDLGQAAAVVAGWAMLQRNHAVVTVGEFLLSGDGRLALARFCGEGRAEVAASAFQRPSLSFRQHLWGELPFLGRPGGYTPS